MQFASKKAKGRKACLELRDEILKYLPGLEHDDVHATNSSVGGKDIRLSPKARSLLPLVFEVKNQESIQIWQAYAQAEEHWQKEISREEVYPAVVFRRNRSDLMICLSVEDLFHLLFVRGKNVQKSIPQKETSDATGGIRLP